MRRRGSLKRRNNLHLWLNDIFSFGYENCSNFTKAVHFVNHHSFVMLYDRGFTFNREYGNFYVDGVFLKITLWLIGIKYSYIPGPVYLSSRLKGLPKSEVFFAVASNEVSHVLNDLGYIHNYVVPHVTNLNVDQIAETISRAANRRLVVMGIGSPSQDILAQTIAMHYGNMEVLCVGAAVEFLCKIQRSTPSIFRKTGFEWLWRLITNYHVTLPRITTSVYRFMALMLFGKCNT